MLTEVAKEALRTHTDPLSDLSLSPADEPVFQALIVVLLLSYLLFRSPAGGIVVSTEEDLL
jgi:hypothetical protein